MPEKITPDFLFKDKRCRVLLNVLKNEEEEVTGAEIVRQEDLSPSPKWIYIILENYHDFGLLESEETGRKKVLKLTEEGREIAELLRELYEKLNTPEDTK